MVEIDKTQGQILAPLYADSEDTLILSYTQGHMGRGWVDNPANPTCAQILVGDFCFHAGSTQSEEAIALVKNIPADYSTPWMLFIPQNEKWGGLLEAAYPKFDKYKRYAIKKEPGCFDLSRLQSLVDALPEGYELARIDAELYQKALEHDFSREFCSQFASAEDYGRRGLGYCVLYNGVLVGGASSYTMYDSGIEIEVDVLPEHRRKGIAAACSARLILECLDRGLYPSWDAANPGSVALAEKLGYHFSHEYDTYSIDLPDREDS